VSAVLISTFEASSESFFNLSVVLFCPNDYTEGTPAAKLRWHPCRLVANCFARQQILLYFILVFLNRTTNIWAAHPPSNVFVRGTYKRPQSGHF